MSAHIKTDKKNVQCEVYVYVLDMQPLGKQNIVFS